MKKRSLPKAKNSPLPKSKQSIFQRRVPLWLPFASTTFAVAVTISLSFAGKKINHAPVRASEAISAVNHTPANHEQRLKGSQFTSKLLLVDYNGAYNNLDQIKSPLINIIEQQKSEGRINSASLQAKIEKNNLDALQLALTADYTAAVEEYKKQNTSLNYYNSEGLPLAENLFSVAAKSYSAGDISYVEYIQNISQAYQIKTDYLQTLLNRNQSILNLNYLINK